MSTREISWRGAAGVLCAVLGLTGCDASGGAEALCGPQAFSATQGGVTFCGLADEHALASCPVATPHVVDFVGLRVCTTSPVAADEVPERLCVDATGQACDALTLVVPGLYLGAACELSDLPSGGLTSQEIYVQRPAAGCGVDWCMAYQLPGDPNFTVEDGCDPDQDACPTDAEVEARVFCTCRCDAPEGDEVCACSEGFVCVSISGSRPMGYCVRDELVAAP